MKNKAEKQQVWVVTYVDIDDTWICGVFGSEEKAKEYIDYNTPTTHSAYQWFSPFCVGRHEVW